MDFISISDKGLERRSNQDFVFGSSKPIGNLDNLFIVADGMGGHKAGDFASRYSIEMFIKYVEECTDESPISIMTNAIKTTNEAVINKADSNEDLKGMGTTFVVATIIDQQLLVANVGDSRLYIIDDDIRQITRDHSLVQEMVEEGKINNDDAYMHPNKNIITRAVGVKDQITPDFFEVNLKKGNIILMCSDGLTNMLDDEEIMNIVRDNEDKLDIAAHNLVDRANERGGKDNISIIIVKF